MSVATAEMTPGRAATRSRSLREELDGAVGRVAVDAGIDGHHEDVVRAEADVDAGGASQAAEEESGGAEQDERHGDLRDDEDVAQAEATAGTGEGVLAFERAGEDGARGDPGGDEAEEQTGGDAKSEGVEQDSPIDADGEIEWYGRGEMECREADGLPRAREDAEDAAAEGEQDAFDEHLAEETGAGGSEGEADGHLTLAGCRPGRAGGWRRWRRRCRGPEGLRRAETQGRARRWIGRVAAGSRPARSGSSMVFFGGGVGRREVFGEGGELGGGLSRG